MLRLLLISALFYITGCGDGQDLALSPASPVTIDKRGKNFLPVVRQEADVSTSTSSTSELEEASESAPPDALTSEDNEELVDEHQAPPEAAPPPCLQSKSCSESVIFSTSKSIVHYRTHTLSQQNNTITHAVIVIHGSERNGDLYFDYAISGLKMADDALAYTAIFAPFFQSEAASDTHHWSSYGWRKGDESSDGSRFSSFSAMNELQEKLIAAFPGLIRISFIGHSAGGQFTNRYAGGALTPFASKVETRYVVMNSASYLYIDDFRSLEIDCNGHNDYLYGLDDRNIYMNALDANMIIENYFSRKMYLLIGEKDTKTEDLEMTCGAKVQGGNRLIRARNYRDYIRRFDDWRGNAYFGEISGVGHNAKGMLTSLAARNILYNDETRGFQQIADRQAMVSASGYRTP